MPNSLPSAIKEAIDKTGKKQIELAGVGCFAHVFKIADTGFAVKKTFDHPAVGNLQPSEKRIYERLGHHPFILRYYGEYCGSGENDLPEGLVFQYLQSGTLADNLSRSKYVEERARWPLQAAEALRYIHSQGVIHSDVGSHNFLIQEDGTLALADFGGSVIDDTPAVVSYSTRYSRPMPITDDSDSTEIDDLFALGTVIYEIAAGNLLYANKSSKEIRNLLKIREFPDLEAFPANVRKVIKKCWANEYQSAEEVIFDLNTTYPSRRLYLLHITGISLGIAAVLLIAIRRRL